MEVYRQVIEKLQPQCEALAILVEHRNAALGEAARLHAEAYDELQKVKVALRQLRLLTGDEEEVDY